MASYASTVGGSCGDVGGGDDSPFPTTSEEEVVVDFTVCVNSGVFRSGKWVTVYASHFFVRWRQIV